MQNTVDASLRRARAGQVEKKWKIRFVLCNCHWIVELTSRSIVNRMQLTAFSSFFPFLLLAVYPCATISLNVYSVLFSTLVPWFLSVLRMVCRCAVGNWGDLLVGLLWDLSPLQAKRCTFPMVKKPMVCLNNFITLPMGHEMEKVENCYVKARNTLACNLLNNINVCRGWDRSTDNWFYGVWIWRGLPVLMYYLPSIIFHLKNTTLNK